MEWDQLSWERFILGMPLLYEDLPFLRHLDNAPEVSVYEALDILQPTPSSTTENTREHSYPTPNTGQSVMNSHSPTPASNTATAEGALHDASKAQKSNDRPKRMKRACKICTQRKIKCNLISGSDPMVCESCSKKGLVCEFDEKKVYTRSSA
ncbi:hypothetical protein KCU61_g4871, partial [Aureobasidium melanogenum]